ncbi:tyrosine-type recombinase/integrase [Glutamicibacter ardleyensis]|uniref:tyrosine-type recombinase/integrase n=1 Tax=Glutamicibacter ardleyensis TaxID=225894 RepID=UPI003F90F3F8
MNRSLDSYQDEYLQLRHAMGHKLKVAEAMIARYLNYLHDINEEVLTVDTAVIWSCLPTDAANPTKAAHLSAIRGFSAYVHARDPLLAELIPPGLIPARATRQQPYIYSDSQVEAMMSEALSLRPVIRGLTLQTLIGLMAATGMRISECLGLNLADIDWPSGILTVHGKNNSTRLVPVHPSTVAALKNYLRLSRAAIPGAEVISFFIGSTGNRPHPTGLQAAFRTVRVNLDYTPRPGGKNPRLHDLRHSFATNTLVQAYRDGVDVDARIVVLATYLGHVSPESTYWYLSSVPELLALVEERVSTAQHQGALLS